MIISDRLRELREERKLSQGDIEKRTGLLRCYISRVENGHTVPAIMCRHLSCQVHVTTSTPQCSLRSIPIHRTVNQ